MRSGLVVVLSPCLDRCLCIEQAREVILVQALVSKLSVEALDEGVLDRFPRLDERESDTVSVSPEVERLSLELRSVVTNDRLWKSALSSKPVESEPPVLPEASDPRRWPGIPW